MHSILQSKGIGYAIDMVGGDGKYQVKTIGILMMLHLFRAFWLLYYAFLTQAPVFLCKDANGVSYECNELNGGCALPENERRFSDNSPNSLAIDLGLYCEKAYVRTLASTLFFVGGNIGAGYYSYLSDAKGRKAALSLCYFLGSLSYLFLGTLAIGPLTYMLGIMAVWGNFSSFCSLSITYASEISNEKFGKNASLIILLGITGGELLIVLLAYLIPSWRILFLFFMAIPAFCSNLLFKFLDESPVFLSSKGDTDKAVEVLKKMADANGNQIDAGSPPNAAKTSINRMSVQSPPKPKKSWNYFSIMVHPKLRLRVFVFSILKFYLNMAFFGCIFALSSLGGSIYTNSTIAGFAEGLGYVLALKAYLFATKKLLKASLQIVVATGIAFLLIPTLSCDNFFLCSPSFLQGLLALIMRTAICFICGFMFNVGNELFPPEVRCQSIGISEIFACLGGMVAPFVIVAAEVNHLSPLFLFGTLGFFALTVSKYLPETQLTSLDDDNADIEMSYMKMTDKGRPGRSFRSITA